MIVSDLTSFFKITRTMCIHIRRYNVHIITARNICIFTHRNTLYHCYYYFTYVFRVAIFFQRLTYNNFSTCNASVSVRACTCVPGERVSYNSIRHRGDRETALCILCVRGGYYARESAAYVCWRKLIDIMVMRRAVRYARVVGIHVTKIDFNLPKISLRRQNTIR